jgi:hypothetical protein
MIVHRVGTVPAILLFTVVHVAGTWARETAVEYYEDRQTGSIYSMRELTRLLLQGQIRREETPGRLALLPHGACSVIEQAEAIAAQAIEQQERDWFDDRWG